MPAPVQKPFKNIYRTVTTWLNPLLCIYECSMQLSAIHRLTEVLGKYLCGLSSQAPEQSRASQIWLLKTVSSQVLISPGMEIPQFLWAAISSVWSPSAVVKNRNILLPSWNFLVPACACCLSSCGVPSRKACVCLFYTFSLGNCRQQHDTYLKPSLNAEEVQLPDQLNALS